ncbi:MAG: cytochrome c oxidase subunit II [Betaproteobacteria bacterium]
MNLPFLPEPASALAPRYDSLFVAMTVLTSTVALLVIALMLLFAYRYRRGAVVDRVRAPPAEREQIRRRIEIAWIALPLLFFVAAFGWAAALYFDRSSPPAGALEVAVVAKQWMWTLEHATGQREIDQLHVPVNVPVKLVMTSQDAIHSFFVPAFRVKQDVLPGRYTVLWFTATRTGDFDLFCAEYCGTDHARMFGHVIALEPPQYQRWLDAHGDPTMAMRGEALFRQFGCSGCHGANAAVHAPSLDGLYGRPVPLADGTMVMADDRYIRDSILVPRKEVAAGYAPIMPSFAGQIGEADILDLIAYIRHRADAETPVR